MIIFVGKPEGIGPMKTQMMAIIILCLIVSGVFWPTTTVSAASKGWVEGTVTEPFMFTGLPLEGVTVSVVGKFIWDVTDSNGRYNVSLDPGTYDLQFSLPGYDTVTKTGISVQSGKTTTLDVTLHQSKGNLKGKVTDKKSGYPIFNAFVKVKELFLTDTNTDIFGTYAFDDLPVGTYNVTVSMGKYKDVTKKVTLLENKDVTLDFQMEKSVGNIKGKVTDKATGSAIAGVTVSVEEAMIDNDTDVNGNYILVDLDVGNYSLYTFNMKYASGTMNVEVKAGADTTANLQLNHLTALLIVGVAMSDGKTPIAGATVIVGDKTNKTNALGGVSFDLKDWKVYDITVKKSGYKTYTGKADLRSGMNITIVKMREEPLNGLFLGLAVGMLLLLCLLPLIISIVIIVVLVMFLRKKKAQRNAAQQQTMVPQQGMAPPPAPPQPSTYEGLYGKPPPEKVPQTYEDLYGKPSPRQPPQTYGQQYGVPAAQPQYEPLAYTPPPAPSEEPYQDYSEPSVDLAPTVETPKSTARLDDVENKVRDAESKGINGADARRCLNLARQYETRGNSEKAEYYAQKALDSIGQGGKGPAQ